MKYICYILMLLYFIQIVITIREIKKGLKCIRKWVKKDVKK